MQNNLYLTKIESENIVNGKFSFIVGTLNYSLLK